VLVVPYSSAPLLAHLPVAVHGFYPPFAMSNARCCAVPPINRLGPSHRSDASIACYYVMQRTINDIS
jgi:hypothetical protein